MRPLLSLSFSLTLRQGYSLSTNNDETESPPSLEPQVLFAFRDCFDSFPADDQICSPHESDSHAGDPFEPFLQLGRSHTPIIQLSSVVPLAFSQSDDPVRHAAHCPFHLIEDCRMDSVCRKLCNHAQMAGRSRLLKAIHSALV